MKPMSSNVIAFRQPRTPAPQFLVVRALIDPNRPLEQGDLVALCWTRKDGTPGEVLFWRWWGPTGRDCHGRFVPKGSPRECYELDGMKYCIEDLNDGHFKILGKVLGGGSAFEQWTPS
jgi:hypothetical protein